MVSQFTFLKQLIFLIAGGTFISNMFFCIRKNILKKAIKIKRDVTIPKPLKIPLKKSKLTSVESAILLKNNVVQWFFKRLANLQINKFTDSFTDG